MILHTHIWLLMLSAASRRRHSLSLFSTTMNRLPEHEQKADQGRVIVKPHLALKVASPSVCCNLICFTDSFGTRVMLAFVCDSSELWEEIQPKMHIANNSLSKAIKFLISVFKLSPFKIVIRNRMFTMSYFPRNS